MVEGRNECILATKILQNPDLIKDISEKYVILFDQSMGVSPKFNNLNKAINLMAEKGWRCVNVSALQSTAGMTAAMMYALTEKISCAPRLG